MYQLRITLSSFFKIHSHFQLALCMQPMSVLEYAVFSQSLFTVYALFAANHCSCCAFCSQSHSTKKPVTTMLTYPWKCTVLHCNHLGNTWKPLVLMTRHFDYCPSASEGDNQSVRSSAPVVSRCFPGGYNVKLYISRGRLAWWLLAFLHSVTAQCALVAATGSNIWVLGVGGVGLFGGYTTHTDPDRRLGLVSLYDMLPPYSHSPDLPPPK